MRTYSVEVHKSAKKIYCHVLKQRGYTITRVVLLEDNKNVSIGVKVEDNQLQELSKDLQEIKKLI